MLSPEIVAVEKDFLVVYKPPRLHSAPKTKSNGATILDWCAATYPEIRELGGWKAGEGGLLHRLDYETHGLLLIARNSLAMEAFLAQQQEGRILKEYSALVLKSDKELPGFPKEKPELPHLFFEGKNGSPFTITSAFRAYGPGRKEVRPVFPPLIPDAGRSAKTKELYRTEILAGRPVPDAPFPYCLFLRLRIQKGFRHQIRNHLAWLQWPILNDALYGGPSAGKGLLALRACSLIFIDPSSGEERNYSIPPLAYSEI